MVVFIRSDVETIDPEDVFFLFLDIQTTQFIQVATLTVLVYDILLTVDKEIKYFWKSPMRTVNAVFFASASSLTLVYPDILVIRILALYSRDRRLATFLKALLAVEAASKLTLMIYNTYTQRITIGAIGDGRIFCTCHQGTPYVWGILNWIIPLSFGSLLMILAVYKAAEFWKMSAGLTGFSLVKVLIQDQLIYYALVISCCVFDILQFSDFAESWTADLFAALGSPIFLCILGSRLLFNLKEAGERGLNEGTSYRPKDVSEMEFCAV
ncbi:uncharacterized protein FOMMEDRAFT_160095 [Fomitiporia mediterranea MF3/22]|uniref:uncharacterized protein n=1 Tax=Fomitiporia mediterranea (strain MF3/22) TaxID=694068 RepID=UPI0004407541|nr:uncharacterized protein FOMMEDRAFT_160095 [Fomitiporia mediterranea MF3/22]EJC99668.1 hypothetical protein FOMMEDRAFT_160095 [Fomitiporia mediterranea MF3/22]